MSIGIIGCGMLGRSLLTSFQKKYTNLEYVVSAKTVMTVQFLRSMYQVRSTTDNREVASSSQILLCVNPRQAKGVCKSIRKHLKSSGVVVSPMAAVPLVKLQEWLDHDRVVKIMPTINPNGPVAIYNPQRCHFLLPSDNLIEVANEADLDLTTAVSGCMPGFLSYLLKEWIEAAVQVGLNRQVAEDLILSNLKALGQLDDLKNADDLFVLLWQVSSKGGATERGIKSLERSGIQASLFEMLRAADDRVTELSKKFRLDE